MRTDGRRSGERFGESADWQIGRSADLSSRLPVMTTTTTTTRTAGRRFYSGQQKSSSGTLLSILKLSFNYVWLLPHVVLIISCSQVPTTASLSLSFFATTTTRTTATSSRSTVDLIRLQLAHPLSIATRRQPIGLSASSNPYFAARVPPSSSARQDNNQNNMADANNKSNDDDNQNNDNVYNKQVDTDEEMAQHRLMYHQQCHRRRESIHYQLIAAKETEDLARRMEKAYPSRFTFHESKWN